MNSTAYIINAILVLLVIHQIRESQLNARSLVRPVILVAVVAVTYLHSIPLGGNDVVLEVAVGATGALMGALCALTTHMRLGNDRVALVRAGFVAAALWVGGVSARMAFVYSSGHGFGPSIARFSVRHDITGASAWVAALLLMALADVLTRTFVLFLRSRQLANGAPTAALVPAAA